MEVELSFAEALVFRRALNALRSVCKDIRVYVHRNSLHLEGLNDSRTAWMQVAFARCFFSSFRLPRRSNAARSARTGVAAATSNEAVQGGDVSADSDTAEERFEATVSGKQLWKAIAKAVSPSGSTSGRGTLTLDRMLIKGILSSTHRGATGSSALSLTFFFRGLPVTQTVLISAVHAPHTLPVFIRWKRRHVIAMPARSWTKLLDEYLLNPENVTLVHDVAGEALKVQSEWQPHAQHRRDRENAEEAKQTAAFQGLYGEIVLERNHFDSLVFDSRLPAFSHLTFSSRELRVTAALCEHFDAAMTVSYRLPGRPVVCCFGAAAPLAAGSLQEETPVSASSSASSDASTAVFVPHQVLRQALRRVQEEFEAARGMDRLSSDAGVFTPPDRSNASSGEKACGDGRGPGEDEGAWGGRGRQERRGALRDKHRASRAWAGFVWISTSPLDLADGSVSDDVASVWGDDYLDYVELYRQLEEPIPGGVEEFFASASAPSSLSFSSASQPSKGDKRRSPPEPKAPEARERNARQRTDRETRKAREETGGRGTSGSQTFERRERAWEEAGTSGTAECATGNGLEQTVPHEDASTISASFFEEDAEGRAASRIFQPGREENGDSDGARPKARSALRRLRQWSSSSGGPDEAARLGEASHAEKEGREDDEESVATWLGEDEEAEPEAVEVLPDSGEAETLDRDRHGDVAELDRQGQRDGSGTETKIAGGRPQGEDERTAELRKAQETSRETSRALARLWIEKGGLSGAAQVYRRLTSIFAK
ncbi:conserved hypothetical protein [Neospora caninum Liverpool]|uniref:Rad9 protein n=1 Tax=Neospora caninum (strain Liverpool) TaxID=572307 RepID=F0VHF6_NEOCL|nr:conserved hypothetical protein [Neospora caninum Liverpool]CBZ53150.1 conserved hypothetical protein [Neospora caninum Liverpool]|eukprot:XP_003883182.1 conserved hypothetical protein [Neospora caninum Liverpool]